jgi:hypothetical protein
MELRSKSFHMNMVVVHLSPSYLVHMVEVEVISYGILHVVVVQLLQSYPVIIVDV